MLYSNEQYALEDCRECEIAYVWPMPEAGQLATLYREHDHVTYEGMRHEESRADARRALDLLGRHLRRGRLLDVGCSGGVLLQEASIRGWEVMGLEPSGPGVDSARRRLGQVIVQGTVEEFTPDQPFDVVTMTHVVEHLSDPLGAMRRVHAFLRPGGLVFLSTPNRDSLRARFSGADAWAQGFDADGTLHTYSFSPRGMRSLLRRAGFSALELRSVPYREGNETDFGFLALAWRQRLLARVGWRRASVPAGSADRLGLRVEYALLRALQLTVRLAVPVVSALAGWSVLETVGRRVD
ncbi:MAG: class I SAM-dependent methyltransferase [Chloroflexi bacterium]|nr:class I SAM-dependent methyltransferase [Chloroflexota bacterium]